MWDKCAQRRSKRSQLRLVGEINKPILTTYSYSYGHVVIVDWSDLRGLGFICQKHYCLRVVLELAKYVSQLYVEFLSIQVEFSLLPYPYSNSSYTTTPVLVTYPPPFPISDTSLIYK